MNMLVLGATGRVGREVVRYALADGWHVTAFVRSPEKVLPHERLNIIKGNVLRKEDVRQAMKGVDVVVSALNTDGNQTLSKSMPFIVEAMEQEGIARLVTVGTAGILQSRIEPELLRYQSSESRRTNTLPAEDHEAAYRYLETTNLQWTIVCPTYLPDGEATGIYRVEVDQLPVDGRRITVGDTAHCVYKQLMSDTYNRKRVGLAY